MDNDPASGTLVGEPASLTVACGPCPAATPGKIGGGYRFDGATRVVLASSTWASLSPYSISVWVDPETSGGLYSAVSKPHDLVSPYNVVSLTVEPAGGTAGFETSNAGMIESVPTPQDLRDAWHHVALTWDGTTRRIYVDGALAGSAVGGFDDSSLPLVIGGDLDGNVPMIFYRGALDELRFYDRALDASEITALATVL